MDSRDTNKTDLTKVNTVPYESIFLPFIAFILKTDPSFLYELSSALFCISYHRAVEMHLPSCPWWVKKLLGKSRPKTSGQTGES